MAAPNRIYVSLGSNIEAEQNLAMAVRLLAERGRLVAVSPVYETVPVGLREQANFLNAAVLVETELSAARFKREVLAVIEAGLGRVRTADKNAPRTIDADIALFNNEVFELGRRHIPDPDVLKFPHVAVPLADVAPELLHPETGERLVDIAARLVTEASREGGVPLWIRPDVVLSK
jgi:2-amino-4-hydroxy-6-hydroxymethyldihydropteridine diphosphokinase